MTILTGLNEEQVEVVKHIAGPILVQATAGSGKTTALTRRIAYLVKCGIEPARILAVTFSVKAAREMSERLIKLGCIGVAIRTFHSLALLIVRAEQPHLAQWKIDDSERYRYCVKDAVSFKYMDWKQADVTHLQSYITRCKAAAAFPTDPKAVAIAEALFQRRRDMSRDPKLCQQAYVTAETIRCERQLLTFDDMLLEAWRLLSTDEDARVRWAGQFDSVLQDELQDESYVQHHLASYLARDHRNYMVVGDVGQAIYSWRGSDPQLMLRFKDEWQARVVSMNRNYRSAKSIVALANKSIDAMPPSTHLGTKMIATRQETGSVRLTEYEDFDAEGEGVTEKILESHEDGRTWKAHVVLYRTNAQSRGVEEQLLSAAVPYVVLGGTNFYDRREVKDLLAYLRVAAGIGEFDDVKRSINTPFRYLGKAFIEGLESAIGLGGPFLLDSIKRYLAVAKLQKRQLSSAMSWCQLVQGVSDIIRAGEESESPSRASLPEHMAKPATLLEGLVRDLKYSEWLTRDEGVESPENNRVSNVRELIRAAGRFPTVAKLLEYVDDTRKRAEKAKRESIQTDVVTLCSIHRAKGLEWSYVFVLGVNEKILPHAYAEDEHEERRLFYVACTRAADVLELSYVARAAVSNKVLDLKPSRFLTEAGLNVAGKRPT